jgi:acetyltransferase-like isoleucine patch superfamily enzyme
MHKLAGQFKLDEEGRRSVAERGWLGHYIAGAYRVTARPIARRKLIAHARLKAFVWGTEEVANMLERLPTRYIIPLLQAFGATVADNATILEGVRLTTVRKDAFRPLKIGRLAYFGRRVMIDLADEVIFGDCCAIGNDTRFFTHTDLAHTPLVAEIAPVTIAPIKIGRGTFVGPNSTVVNGVTIGECCLIGANSVVMHDIPPYSLAAGAPAKVIRELDRSKVPPFDAEEAFIIPAGTTDR